MIDSLTHDPNVKQHLVDYTIRLCNEFQKADGMDSSFRITQ